MDKNSKASKGVQVAYVLGYRMTKEGEMINTEGELVLGSVRNGYRVAFFTCDRIQYPIYFHKLQAYCKYGEAIFNTDCVRHKNDIRTDNSDNNILIGSYQENVNDMYENNIKKRKEVRMCESKYSFELKMNIIEEYANGGRLIDLSRKYNVPTTTIYYIVNRKRLKKSA